MIAALVTTSMAEPAVVLDARRPGGAAGGADHVRATFLPELGLICSSLRFAGGEHLSLHGGLAAFRSQHTTGMALLAPWANRISQRRFRVGGSEVDLSGLELHADASGQPMHGTMLGARRWEVRSVESAADGSEATLVAGFRYESDQLLAAFPFPHEIEVRAHVVPGSLSLSTSVRPTGSVAVPVSFGWHPYMRIPGAKRSQLGVRLPARRRIVVDERQIPTGEEVPEDAEVLALVGSSLDAGFRMGSDRTLALTDGARSVEVALDEGYGCAQVYAPAGRSFAAIEPMVAPTDALVSGDHPTVAPGDTYTATFRVQLSHRSP